MPPTAKELREKRLPMAQKIRELADRANARADGAWEGDEESQWVAVNSDYNALSRQIERAERTEAIEAEQRTIVTDPAVGRGALTPPADDGQDGKPQAITDEHRTLAMKAWFSAQLGRELTQAQREAAYLCGLNPGRKVLELATPGTKAIKRLQDAFKATRREARATNVAQFRAALSSQVGPQGSYLIPPESLMSQLEINLLYYGGIMEVADVMETDSGERISWPTADDTTNKGRRLGPNTAVGTGGAPASTGASDPGFAKVFWDAYKYTTDAVLVPYELIEDAEADLPSVLGELLGIRLGRIWNTEFTTGNGNSMPKGIVPCATTFTASIDGIVADDLIGLIHSVDPAYRQMPDCGFMMHDSIMLLIRKLKDGVGQYLWQSGLQQGMPDKLLSYPHTINQDMDSVTTTGKKPVLFGHLPHFKVRRVKGIRMYRLEERYRDSDQDAFLAFARADANLLTAGTPPIKVLTMP